MGYKKNDASQNKRDYDRQYESAKSDLWEHRQTLWGDIGYYIDFGKSARLQGDKEFAARRGGYANAEIYDAQVQRQKTLDVQSLVERFIPALVSTGFAYDLSKSPGESNIYIDHSPIKELQREEWWQNKIEEGEKGAGFIIEDFKF